MGLFFFSVDVLKSRLKTFWSYSLFVRFGLRMLGWVKLLTANVALI